MSGTAFERLGEMHFADIDQVYAVLGPVMEAIAAALGPHCEVVLHDLTRGDLEHTIFAILNGHVSGRVVGGPSTNLAVDVLRDEKANHDAFGYPARTADGRELRSSSVYFRDNDNRIIASLCINVDQTPLQSALRALSEMGAGARTEAPQEIVGPDISSVLDSMIDEAMQAVGGVASRLDKAARIEVLRALEARGAFAIKRAAEVVAGRLGVSRVTVYGYLEEVRRD